MEDVIRFTDWYMVRLFQNYPSINVMPKPHERLSLN